MASTIPCRFDPPGRVVAIGDIHGNFEGLARLLRVAGLADETGHWAGKETFLVQTGDIVGRGGFPRHIYFLLRRLGREARQAGGGMEFLLGNHEALAMHNIHSYTTLQEYRDFSPRVTVSLDEWLRKSMGDIAPSNPGKSKEELDMLALHQEPLGWIEFRRAMAPTGAVGRWLCRLNSVVRVGRTLFVHGGLHPRFSAWSLEELNDLVREEMRRPKAYFELDPRNPALMEDGPHWYRVGHGKSEEELSAELDQVLPALDCDRMVVGHTPTFLSNPHQAGRILTRCGGRLVSIDVGIGRAYGGRLAALEISPDGTLRALYPSGAETL